MTRLWMWTPLLAAALWLPLGCADTADTEPDPDAGNQTTTDGETPPPGGTAKQDGPSGRGTPGGTQVAGGTPKPKTDGAAKTNSNVLLSWRVAILPFIEQSALYDQFHHDEPWDSPHNKALIAKMPEIYKVSDQTKPGHTQFVAVQGEGMAIDGLKPRSFRDITDGTSNAIWLVTVKPEHAVPWTKPDDLQVDPADVAQAMQKLGGVSDGFIAGFFDGSVRVLDSTNLQPEVFKKLVQIADGQTIDPSEFDPDFGPDIDFGTEVSPPDFDFGTPPAEPTPPATPPAESNEAETGTPPEPAFPQPECQEEPAEAVEEVPADGAAAGAADGAAGALPEAISDLAYIPQNAAAVLSLRPQTVLNSEMIQMLTPEQQTDLRNGMVFLRGLTGIDPNTVERLSVVFWPGESELIPAQGPGPQMDAAAFIRLSQPVTLEQIKQSVAPTIPYKLVEGKAGEITYVYAEGDEAPPVAVAVPNEKLIVIGSKANIGTVLMKPAVQGGLLEKVAQTDMNQTIVFVARMDPVREDLKQLAAAAPKLPDAPDAEQLTTDLDGLTFAANLDKGLKVTVQLDAAKPQTVQELKQQFDQWREQIGASREEMVNEFAQQHDQEVAQQVQQVADQVYESLQASVDGDMLNVSVTLPKSAIELAKTLGEAQAQQAVRRLELINNAKQLSLAIHNYHDVHGKLPFPGVVKK